MDLGTRKYHGGIDALGSILRSDGVRGLYRGFGMSVLTYAPSNALWWASYSMAQRSLWCGMNYKAAGNNYECIPPSSSVIVGCAGSECCICRRRSSACDNAIRHNQDTASGYGK
ncbi:hypothetical protein O6H91_04G095500 [Diphasiastrum complanatum]|uniref:Uncharacterized protein n=1 Tax=Diphasiastrum complanatum TaxID=34168 RepID=A0ACC2DZI9_DIPCM|nr:hypothetical protein O6H91_04G095500 [Diphasiastrum complanatum]